MDIRAWGVGVLVLMAGVHPAGPVDAASEGAACELLIAARAVPGVSVDQAVLIAAEVPTAAAPAATDENWIAVQLQARPQYAMQPDGSTVAPYPAHPRNPAGQLVLPGPQTSRAPAF